MIGVVSLVAEYGLALQRQQQDQRIADAAAYAAALYCTAHVCSPTVPAAAISIAQNVAALNGVPSTGVAVTPTTSPADSTKSALMVTVTTSAPLFLAEVLAGSSNKSLTTQGVSYAQFGGGIPACITTLSSSTGVTLSGGTSISAPQCGVSSNASLTVPCGTTITAKGVTYGGATPTQGCNGITTSTLTHASVTDPLASSSGVVAAENYISNLSLPTLSAPAAPTSSGTNVSFSLSYYPTTAQTNGGCTATYSGSTWTITCPAGASYNFTNLTVGGGQAFAIATSGSGTTNFTFQQDVTKQLSGGTVTFASANYNFISGMTVSGSVTLTLNSAGTVNFGKDVSITNGPTATFNGAGAYNFSNGLTVSGGSNVTFANNGTFKFGQSASKCSSEGYFSICDTSTITFSGTNTFSLASGIYVGGGSTLTMGSGTANSYQIAAASDGNAIWLGGGGKIVLADATGSSSLFQVNGNINADQGGGSCMTLPAATNHDIKGSFATAGGTILGSGTYTITGYLSYGNNGGGSVTCNGYSVGLWGVGVTIIYGASTTPSSGTCKNLAICFTAGFSNVYVSAPTSGTYANLLFVGPSSTSGISSGVLFSGGATANMTGAFYEPLGAFTMSGGASINSTSTKRPDGATWAGGCFQIVALSVSMSGGTTVASTCISGSGTGSSSPKLVM
ncbi:beta strand repeat-containing protein [Rhodoblastus sp.]|uniref:beta strand repeat-containing protein n=1 Tax=Rhodoblastus sp. TaxID=1962975 RepID=UPI0035AE98EF